MQLGRKTGAEEDKEAGRLALGEKPSGYMTGNLRTQSQGERGQAATHETCVTTPEGLWPAQSPSSLQETTPAVTIPRGRGLQFRPL